MIEPALRTIAEHYGRAHQLEKAAEEAAEFIQAALKYKNAEGNSEAINAMRHLAEEFADLRIMLDQLAYLIPYLVNSEPENRAFKIERQFQRIASEIKLNRLPLDFCTDASGTIYAKKSNFDK